MTGEPRQRRRDGITDWMDVRWDDVGVTRVTVRPELMNLGGLLSGVVAFTLIDYSMGSALWVQTTPEEGVATLNISITYLRTAREGDVVCTSTLDRRTKTNAALRSEVVSEATGEVIATAVGTYAIFPRKKVATTPPS